MRPFSEETSGCTSSGTLATSMGSSDSGVRRATACAVDCRKRTSRPTRRHIAKPMSGSANRKGSSVLSATESASASRASRCCATWIQSPRCQIVNTRQVPSAVSTSANPGSLGPGIEICACER